MIFAQAMQDAKYIDFDSDSVPYKLSIKLSGKTFTFEFSYNQRGDFYTCNLYRGAKVLAFGEILRYGRILFGTIRNGEFPGVDIMPICISGRGINTITRENMGREVKLYIYEQEQVMN